MKITLILSLLFASAVNAQTSGPASKGEIKALCDAANIYFISLESDSRVEYKKCLKISGTAGYIGRSMLRKVAADVPMEHLGQRWTNHCEVEFTPRSMRTNKVSCTPNE